jgi:hypothetical protein
MLIQVYFYQTNFRDDEPARSATEAAPTRWCPASVARWTTRCQLSDFRSIWTPRLRVWSGEGLVR